MRYCLVSDGDHTYACPVDMSEVFKAELELSEDTDDWEPFEEIIREHCIRIDGSFTFTDPQVR